MWRDKGPDSWWNSDGPNRLLKLRFRRPFVAHRELVRHDAITGLQLAVVYHAPMTVAAPQTLVGLISDTHGLIRPDAITHLCGCELIVHCGDIGSLAVLNALRDLAPVRAVRGNIDTGEWASGLPTTDVVEIGGHRLYVLHDVANLALDPLAAGFHAVLSGHSHKPLIETRRGVLFVNPGSAGPRRFTLPVAVARLVLGSNVCEARIVPIAA